MYINNTGKKWPKYTMKMIIFNTAINNSKYKTIIFYKRLHSIEKSQHGFEKLFSVAVDNNDNIYVTDDSSQSVFKFDKNGTRIKVVKPAVKNPILSGIAVSGDKVIVVDADNHQLLCFIRDLEFVKKIDLHSGGPVGVACDEEGKMYVCDYNQYCVKVLSAQGELLYTFGDNDTSHKLSRPHSICVDSEFVYVSEWGNNCVSVFTKQGKNGTRIKIVKPAVNNTDLRGIAVSGDQVIVADADNHQLLYYTRILSL